MSKGYNKGFSSVYNFYSIIAISRLILVKFSKNLNWEMTQLRFFIS